MNDRLPQHALDKLRDVARPLLEEGASIPRQIGKYRIVREVGRGGMGVVYEAYDADLGRRVALKTIAGPAGFDPTLRARFVREAQAAARLNHPNIAAVYDATPDAIAMQFVDGVPLSDLPKTDVRSLVRLVRDAALAVHDAHELGIVHRDLKPHNLLVEGDRVVVTDFGLAKDTAIDSSLSISGHLLGTPAFMAPEQAAGRVHDVDARTDVYGLGATLYAVLSGSPPFKDQEMVVLLRRITDDAPLPLRAVARNVPEDLETIVTMCLAKEKERRYQTALALAEDLTRWLENRPVHARRPTIGYRLSRLASRHRGLVMTAAIAAVALGGAFVVIHFERVRGEASNETLVLSARVDSLIADTEMHQRLGERDLAMASLDAGIKACDDLLDRYDVAPAHLLRGRLLRARGRGDDARRAFDRALDLNPSLALARFERGLVLARELGVLAARLQPPVAIDDAAHLSPEAFALRERAVSDFEAASSQRDVLRRVVAVHLDAELAWLRGDRTAARRGYEEVLRLDPLNIDATVGLSQVEIAEGNDDTARHLAMSAIDLYRGFGPAYLPSGAPGILPPVAGEVDRAVRQHELSAAEQRVGAGDQSPEALVGRATARLQISDIDGALADFTAALKADPSDALAYGNRALVNARQAAALSGADQLDAALAAWDAAIADCSAALKIESNLAAAWNNRGVFRSEKERRLHEAGRLLKSDAERRAAGADFDAAIERSPRFALALENRAMQRRRTAEAAAARREWPAAAEALSGAEDDLVLALALNPRDGVAMLERALVNELRAHVYVLSSEPALADAPKRQAIADFDAAVALSPQDARARGLRGINRLRRGDVAGGVSDLEAALKLAPDARARVLFETELRDAGQR